MFVNGANIGSFGHEKNYTGYLSPYFVFKEGSFTKHYYIGAQRIVSKIGNGRFDNNSGLNGNGITAGGINFAKQQSWYDKKVEEYIASLGIPPGPPDKKGIYGSPEYTGQPYPDFGSPLNESNEPPLGWPKVPVFNQPGDVPGPPIKWGDPVTNDNVEAGWGYEGTGVIEETDLYFYHPDHLGSTSYVTTRLGKVSQHVEYIPFGEVFLEEKNDKWNSPYKFNAKEMDEETGLYYYGARYFDSKVSVWYSVDPLAGYNPIFETEHYIDGQHNGGVYNSGNLNPYIYCYQSPVRYIDPNGKQVDVVHMISGKDDVIIKGSSKVKNYPNTLQITIHAAPQGLQSVDNNKNSIWINDKKTFEQVFGNNEEWKNRGDNFTVIIYGCRAANDSESKSGKSIVTKLSEAYPEVKFIGATAQGWFSENGLEGTYFKNEKGKRGQPGNWLIMKNGKVEGIYDAEWTPKPEPTFIDNLLYKSETINSNENSADKGNEKTK
jgi:RHS repeat-associated protein